MRLTRLSSPANPPLRVAVAGAIEVSGKKTSCNVGSQDYKEVNGKGRTLFNIHLQLIPPHRVLWPVRLAQIGFALHLLQPRQATPEFEFQQCPLVQSVHGDIGDDNQLHTAFIKLIHQGHETARGILIVLAHAMNMVQQYAMV